MDVKKINPKVEKNIPLKPSNEIHFTRFHSKLYFPFLLDLADSEFISRDFQKKYELLGKQLNWEEYAPNNRNFFSHFGSKFYNPQSTNEADKLLAIVRTYRLRDGMRHIIGLKDNVDFIYLYSITRTGSAKKIVLPLKIGDIFLHFFETGLIFVEFNFVFEPKLHESEDMVDFRDIVQCLYRFKELKKNEELETSQDPKKKRTRVIHGFDNVIENGKSLTFYDVYYRLVHQSFQPEFEMKPFQTNDGKDAISHFFSYLYADMKYAMVNYDYFPHTQLPLGQVRYEDVLIMERTPPSSRSLQYILGYGANMYTDEYLVEPLQTGDYLKTFTPYFYRMDGNGAINFVTRNKDRLINFLEDSEGKGHYGSWQKDYALIFLYLLHERYALMQYTSLTNTLLMQMEKFHPKTEADRKKIKAHELEKMSERLLLFVGTYNKFMIRLDVEIASKHEHTNRVYQYYKKQLFIDDLIEDIYYKIDHFKSYSDTLINEQQMTFQKEQSKRTRNYGFVLALFSVLNTIWGLVSGFDSAPVIISIGLALLVIFGLNLIEKK